MSNISEYLEKYKDSRTMESVISDAFFEDARRYAESRIQQKFKASFSGSDIANAAMKSALSELAQGRIVNASSEEFKRLLFAIVRRKVAGQVRYYDRGIRSPQQQVSLDPNLTPGEASTDPVVKKVIDEISANAAVNLLQRHDGEGKNPLRLYVAALGALYDVKPGDIQSALQENFPSEQVPSLRAIQNQRKDDLEFLTAFIRDQLDSPDD